MKDLIGKSSSKSGIAAWTGTVTWRIMCVPLSSLHQSLLSFLETRAQILYPKGLVSRTLSNALPGQKARFLAIIL